MTKNEDLKACPFCGEPASLTNVRMSDHSFYIGCHNQKCLVKPISCVRGDRVAAAHDWNTRPTVTPTDRRKNKRCEGRNACGGCYPAVCLETDGYERARKAAQDSTTDGDAEALEALARIGKILVTKIPHNPQANADYALVLAALQSTRKPTVDIILKALKGADGTLEYIETQLKGSLVHSDVVIRMNAEDRRRKIEQALASLDAVLSEGE